MIELSVTEFDTYEISASTHLATAYDTFVLIVSKGAFVADSGKSCRAYVAVANRALSITLVAQTSNGDARLLPAHNKISDRCQYGSQPCLSVRLTDDGETWLLLLRKTGGTLKLKPLCFGL